MSGWGLGTEPQLLLPETCGPLMKVAQQFPQTASLFQKQGSHIDTA